MEDAAELFPVNFFVEFYTAGWAAARGDYSDAERRIVALRRANPENLLQRATTSKALAHLSAIKGRVRDAERHYADVNTANEARKQPTDYLVGIANASMLDAILRGTPERGVRKVEEAVSRYPLANIDPLDRPYAQLAYVFAVAGRPDRARSLLAERDSAIPNEPRDRAYSYRAYLPRAAIAIAEGRGAEAIAEARRADDGPCRQCLLPLRGRAYELGGYTDSAMVMYEQYLARPTLDRAILPLIGNFELSDAVHLAPILRRLGELYDERGDRQKAAHYYGRFVALWRDADPDLQPQVEDVKRRLARLGGEGNAR